MNDRERHHDTRMVHVVQGANVAQTAGFELDPELWVADGPLGTVVYGGDDGQLQRAAPQGVFEIRFEPCDGELVIRLLRNDECLDTFVAIGPGAPELTEAERTVVCDWIADRFGIARSFFALPSQLC